MDGNYNLLLVASSVVVGIFASYTALDLANGVAVARGHARIAWLSAGALAMGVGIWSMHFVGMLAFRMPGMPISYSIPLLALSTAIAIVASGLALVVVSRRTVSHVALGAAAAAMGAAIAGMHYVGMSSMRMPAAIQWNLGIVAASVAIAVAASFAALWLAFRYRLDPSRNATRIRVGGGVLMGVAIAGMHYTAMAAARFVPLQSAVSLPDSNVLATAGLGVAVTGATLLILAVAIAGSALSRELARRTTLASDAEAARRDAVSLADRLQRQTAHLQQQAATMEMLHNEVTAVQERLRGIIDAALDAMVATDANSIITDWSRHAEAMFGWPAADAIGRRLTETIIPAEHRTRHDEGVRRYFTTGETRILGRRIEITAIRKDGSEFPIELTISAVGTGPETVFISFIRDITDVKRAAEARQVAERRERVMQAIELERSRLKALFEQAPAFIALLKGPEHVFELTNARYDQLVGYRDLVGKPIRFALPELQAQGFVELLDQVYATGEPYIGVGSRVVFESEQGADAREYYVNFVYQPFAGADGSVTGIFVHGVDVTEIVQARHEAEAGSRAKNEFLSRMSHELRTPLNAILGFGQLLQLEAVTNANRESGEHIVRAGRHLLALIDEVLEIARIEAGEISVSVEPVAVSGVIDESVSLVRHMADKHGVSLVSQSPAESQRFVLADSQRLKQVLLNLLSNAIKYNRRDGTVTVRYEEAGDRMRLCVEDTGFGMSPQQVARLFTPFDRLGAEQTAIEGSGLGLAVSRGLMDAMGGTLHIASAEGEGTRTWAELPIVEPPAAVSPDEQPGDIAIELQPDRAESTHTVLVIEDNLANVRLMERIFQRRPHVRLLTAMQGSLGLDLARQHRPALIMLDLNLPDLPGDEVLVALRQDPALRGIPVVMISGDAIPSQVERMLALGARAYLTKPFDLQALFRLIDECLDRDER